jgi:hypothetical protein
MGRVARKRGRPIQKSSRATVRNGGRFVNFYDPYGVGEGELRRASTPFT